jgi:phosphoglycolate phosphatase-like HAD superfamily hydrolase
MSKGALHREASHDELNRICAHYPLHRTEDLGHSEGYGVPPGAEQTLKQLCEAVVLLGLVSGAMEGAARTKLIPANLNLFFFFGAYGSDARNRAELTAVAINKADRLHANLTPSQVAVVGDAPIHIGAAHAAGAMGIGVASGRYSIDVLTDAGADHVLTSLEDRFPDL